jgi:hypothetical protein
VSVLGCKKCVNQTRKKLVLIRQKVKGSVDGTSVVGREKKSPKSFTASANLANLKKDFTPHAH